MSQHHLFLCAEEAADVVPIHQIAQPTITDVNVPGYLKKKQRQHGPIPVKVKVPKVQKLLSEEARVNADGAIKWALNLHRAGKSLNGKFKADDLQKDICNSVKCVATKRTLLKRATIKRKRKDFQRIRKIIKDDIVRVQSETELPHDVKLLLDSLKSYQAGDEVLIANHPGLKTEDGKISLFNMLFSQLEFIKATDPLKYQSVIAALPYGKSSWIPMAYCNQHVMGVYTFRKGMNKYCSSSEGAINLYRNCFQHLIKDHATTQGPGGVPVVLSVRKQMEHMLSTLIPGLIVQLLVVMHQESALGDIFYCSVLKHAIDKEEEVGG